MTPINEQMLKALIDINDFIETWVDYAKAEDSNEYIAPIFAVKRAIEEATKSIYGTLFVVVHTHESGVSTYLLHADETPGEADVIDLFNIDFEPERDEELYIDSFQTAEIATLYKGRSASDKFDKAASAGALGGVPVPVICKPDGDFITLLSDRFGYIMPKASGCPSVLIDALYGEMSFAARHDAIGKFGVLLVTEYMTLDSDEVESEEFIRSLYGKECPEPHNGDVVRYLKPHIEVIMERFPYADVSVDMNGILGRVELRVFVPMDMPNFKDTIVRIGRLMETGKGL